MATTKLLSLKEIKATFLSICYFSGYTLLFMLFALLNLSAQSSKQDSINIIFNGTFDSISPKSCFLLNKGFVFTERLDLYIISSPQTISDRKIKTTTREWWDTYSYLRNSQTSCDKELPSPKTFKLEVTPTNQSVPIGIIFMDGDYIETDTFEKYLDTVTNKIKENATLKGLNIFSISNLRSKVNSSEVIYKLNNLFLFSNRINQINSISIDFDDGQGLKNYPFNSTEILVKYKKPGRKTIVYQLETISGILVSTSQIYVSFVDEFFSESGRIETTLPSGQKSIGSYKIYFGCDLVFDKPFIVVEGFDYKNQTDLDEAFIKYEKAGILEELYSNGYDFVSIQFGSNNDYIQNNAQVLKNLLKHLNQKKKQNFESIIIGESMGGIITRIALKELEKENIDHSVGLFVSFDSPQGGANIPLSIQEWPNNLLNINLDDILFFLPIQYTIPLSFFDVGDLLEVTDEVLDATGIPNPVDNMLKGINSNNSPAARQMSIRHRDFPTKINPVYLDLQNTLKKIGYPDDLRRIALINGSNSAIGQPFSLQAQYLDIDVGVRCLAKFYATARVSPINEISFEASRIKLKFGCSIFSYSPINEKGIFDFFEKPYDNSPGSKKKFPILNDVIPTFVPTVSSIDLDQSLVNSSLGLNYYNESSNDARRRKEYIVENNLSPFNDIYSNSSNSDHIDLGALQEIIPELKEKEFMFYNLFLQNKVIKSNWKRNFYAGNKVTAGRDVNILLPNKLIKKSDFYLQNGSDVEITSENRIKFLPGVRVEQGAKLHAHIQSVDCSFQRPLDFSSSTEREILFSREKMDRSFEQNQSKRTDGLINHKYEVIPNPSRSNFNIFFNTDTPSNVKLTLFNVLGEPVANSGRLYIPGGKSSYSFPRLDASPGVYFLRCEMDNNYSTKKIIIQQ